MKNKQNIYYKYWLILMLVVIVAVYAKAITYDFVLLDDDIKILDNYEKISNPANYKEAFITDSYFQKEGLYYRPTLTLSLISDAFFWEKKPEGYHLTNIILHIISCLLLIYLIGLFMNYPENKKYSGILNTKSETQSLIILTVVFWGINPLLTNAVGWIPGRNDVLLSIGIIPAFIFFIQANDTNKLIYYILHLFFFCFALFSKETALIFPVILLLYEFLIKKKKLITKNNLTFCLLWIPAIIFYLYMRSNVALPLKSIYNLIDNFIFNLPIIFELTGKFFIPVNLSGIPSYHFFNILTGALAYIMMIIILIMQKENRSYLLFAISWIILTILPGMFASRGQTNFDYLECRAYLPMIGIIIFIFPFIQNSKFTKLFSFKFLLIAVIIFYAVLNITISSEYSGPMDFYNNAIEKNPNSALAFNNRALLLKNTGKIQDAINDFTEAVTLDTNFAEAYFNFGTLYVDTGEPLKALELYNKGLSIKPESYKVYLMQANIKYKIGDINGAKKDYETVLRYDSSNPPAYFGLAAIHFRAGDFMDAIDDYDRALKYNPKYIQAYMNRGVTYANMRKYNSAIKDYNSAEKFDKKNSDLFYLRANAKFLNRDTTGACLDWYKAAELGNDIVPRFISEYCR